MNKLYILLACLLLLGSLSAASFGIGDISTTKTKIADYSYQTTLKNGTALATDTVKNSINKATNTMLDCDILTCDYKVEITAKQALTFDATTLKGKYSGWGASVQKIFYQDTKQEERTRPIYGTEKQEQCTTDNKTSTKTCENVTVQVETGTETYYETVGFENTAITTPFAKDEKRIYVIRFVKDSPYRNVDIYHEIYGQERKDAAWWNSTYNYKKQINITNWNCTASFCQFPIYAWFNATTTNGSDIRVLNSAETGELGFWREDGWNYTNASGNLWVNASNQTSVIYVYYGATGVADKTSVDNTFLFGEDFGAATFNASKIIAQGAGTAGIADGKAFAYEASNYESLKINSTTYSGTYLNNSVCQVKVTAATGAETRFGIVKNPQVTDGNDGQMSLDLTIAGQEPDRRGYYTYPGGAPSGFTPFTATNYSANEIWKFTHIYYNSTRFTMRNGSFNNAAGTLITGWTTDYNNTFAYDAPYFGTQGGSNSSIEYFLCYPVPLTTPTFTFGAQESAPGTTGTLTVNYTTGGTAIGSNSTFTPPANLTINATASAGYSFVNWTENCNGTVANTTNPNTQIEVLDATACYAQANFAESAPVINSSTILPAIAYQYNSLLGYCNATTATTSVTYNYTWYLNGAVNASGSVGTFTQGVNINVANVSSSLVAVGQNWTLQCLAYNANGASQALNSSVKTIQNTTASITAITITPATASKSTNLSCNITVTDSEHATTNITGNWSRNGTVILAFSYNGVANNTATLVANLTTGNFSKGDNISCSAVAFDGIYYSPLATSANKTISNSAPSGATVGSFANASIGHSFTVNGSVTDLDGGSDIAVTTATASTGACVQLSNSTSGTTFNVRYNCTSTTPGTANITIAFTDKSTAYVNGSALNAYPDHAASMTSPTLTPATIYTVTTVTCNFGAFSDIDNDTENITARVYAWQYNGATVAGQTASTFDLNAYGANNSANVSCSIFSTNSTWASSNATNMSANKTITPNYAPTITVQNTFTNSTTGHSFAVLAGARDNDTGDGIAFTNITSTFGTCAYVSNTTLGNALNVTYLCTSTASGTTNITVRFTDKIVGAYNTTTSSSNAYPDHAPALTAPTITPTLAHLNDTLTCNPGVFSDVDNDTENVSARSYKWYVNGVLTATTQTLASGAFAVGDNITCTENSTNSSWTLTAQASSATFSNILGFFYTTYGNRSGVVGVGTAFDYSASAMETATGNPDAFGLLIMATVFIGFYIIGSRYTQERALVYATFVTTVVAFLLVSGNFLSPNWLILSIIALLAAIYFANRVG